MVVCAWILAFDRTVYDRQKCALYQLAFNQSDISTWMRIAELELLRLVARGRFSDAESAGKANP